ncbi:MAG: dihydrodipicolinate synthase family protein [Candidatus Latescibacteria bacterium]|nr:dihydrodipicolinate synthase family protein [Candidatus Latescibacterota bacterium]
MRFTVEQIKSFEGVYSAILTPFDNKRRLNEAVLRRLVNYQLEQGLHGFFVCGSTGEGFLMTPDERRRVAEVVVEETTGRGKVIVHVGHISSDIAASLAHHAEKLGADAISSTPPIYYAVGIEGTFYHYKIIAGACSLPFLAYNIPASTKIGLMSEHLSTLSKMETFIGMKYTGYNLFEMRTITEEMGERGIVLSGSDEMFLPALTMGARGSIGSTQNLLPAKFVEIYQAFQRGEIQRARELQTQVNRVVRVLLKYGSPAWKAYAKELGFDCGEHKPPFKPLTSEQLKGLFSELEATGVL